VHGPRVLITSGDPAGIGPELVLRALRALADPGELANIRPDLPLYIAVGEQDPVNGGLTLLTPLVDRLKDAGLTDVTTVTYPGARHEILNETNRDEVIGALISWLDRVSG